MEADFWRRKWAANEIGFHEAEPHAMLVRHWPALGIAPGGRVLVPLCGKSQDMLWLRARGYAVVGVELSDLAVEAFFAENALSPTRSDRGAFTVHEVPGCTVLCGDFFALTPALLGTFDAIYDRAALIALPPAMRADYAARLTTLAAPATSLLLVTVHYPDAVITPPPFIVAADELARLYDRTWTRDELDTGATQVKGHAATQTAWRLRRRPA